MSCEACQHPGEGRVHTCEGSGTLIASEAHVAGEIEEMAEAWPRWRATIHVQLRGPDESTARGLLAPLVEGVLAADEVEHIDFSLEVVP